MLSISPRPKNSPELIAAYERRLCPHSRNERRVARITGLQGRLSRMRSWSCLTVRRIQAHEFAVTTPPEAIIRQACDLRRLCRAGGIIANQQPLQRKLW